MSKYLDADMLEKDGWSIQRTRRASSTEMIYETKKPTDFPAADVKEVQHGRWVKDKNLYKCTTCNDLLCVAGWADCILEKQIYTAFKYCPNCGAKMDGDEE